MNLPGFSTFVHRRKHLPRRSLVPSLRQAAPQGPIILDNFSDTEGVSLPDHTPDLAPSGSAWNNGNLGISGNQVHYLSSATRQIAVIQAGVADGCITLRCCYDRNGSSSTTSEYRSGIIARYTGIGNFWRIAFHPFSNFGIYEVNAGLAVGRASTSFSSDDGVFHTVSVLLNGTSIQGEIDGEHTITYNQASFNQTATFHGLMIGYSGAVPAADDFRVEHC